jgi:dihydrofolate synthase/folylpolyglutamate synthase
LPVTDSRPTRPATLAGWLAHHEQLHPQAIELGLERVREVALRLGLLPTSAVTLTVAGTNGKGSSVSLAAEIYRQAGYRTGRYLSPHLLRYNERIAIDGVEVSDPALCSAFDAIETARDEISLTYFEAGTLAALWLFREARVDVQVLEVGLGGRLDAVNIVDADCALITPIGLDHTDWLGPDRESIGREKAGILRAARPAVCADPQPPQSLISRAAELGAKLIRSGVDYRFEPNGTGWDWQLDRRHYTDLALPALAGPVQIGNAAGVLAAVEQLQTALPVSGAAIRRALPAFRLRGRFEQSGDVILDVAHNVESAQVLADNLRATPIKGNTRLVLAMFADKPVEAVCRVLAPVIDEAYIAPLPPPRGLDAGLLAAAARSAGLRRAQTVDSVATAMSAARSHTDAGDRIVVCGSFLTVAAAASLLDERNI